jgi:hypothetical protein
MTKIRGSDEGPLNDRLQDFIRQAEVQFGPRNREWVLDGIKFTEADTPNRLMYPSERHIVVELSQAAEHDYDRALFQLAHDAVHVLWPVGVGETKVIEEGVATYHSLTAPRFGDSTYGARAEQSLVNKYQAYRDALNDVRALLSQDPHAISKARDGLGFGSITVESILQYVPTFPPEVAARLVDVFKLTPLASMV